MKRNNGKEIALAIVKAYFGGYEPEKLSDDGMECKTDEEKYKLIENMEIYYVNQEDAQDPFDESDIDTIHYEVTKWVENHNK